MSAFRRAAISAARSVPSPASAGEEEFWLHCRALLSAGEQPEREFEFDGERRWRFDFAWPAQRLAVEVEGGTRYGLSRHSRGAGFEQDARKYNRAAELGWRVLRFSTAMVRSGEAIDAVRRLVRHG